MILFHFTDIDSLEPIMREGLHLGNPNTSPESRCQPGLPWLTAIDSPRGHGLTLGEPVSDRERKCALARYGSQLPASFTHWPDKSRVRIKLVIPSTDRNLVHWIRWKGKRTAANMADLSKCADSTGRTARSWYLYFGVIEPARFTTVHVDGHLYAGDDVLSKAAA